MEKADRGYDCDRFRAALKTRGIAPCIPSRKNRYKRRYKVECAFGKPKDWRRIATRYDRCAHTFFSAIVIAGHYDLLSQLMSLIILRRKLVLPTPFRPITTCTFAGGDVFGLTLNVNVGLSNSPPQNRSIMYEKSNSVKRAPPCASRLYCSFTVRAETLPNKEVPVISSFIASWHRASFTDISFKDVRMWSLYSSPNSFSASK